MSRKPPALIIGLCCFCLSSAAVSGNPGNELAGQPVQVEQIKGDVQAAAQGWKLIDSGALLIDVRRSDEFQKGHIAGAINIPHSDTDALARAIGSDFDRPVVFYCRTGRRVELSKAILEESGYTGIFNASGYEALLETKPGE